MEDYINNPDLFYAHAMERISDHPESRLNPIAKDVIQRGNFIFDAHCHVFDGDCINLKYLATRFLNGIPENFRAGIWRIITGQDLKEEDFISEDDISAHIDNNHALFKKADKDGRYFHKIEVAVKAEQNRIDQALEHEEDIDLRKYWVILVNLKNICAILATKKMSRVYEIFKDKYAITNVYPQEKELITITLGMDLNKGWDNKIKKEYYRQVNELSALAEEHAILPFLPLDPRRAKDDSPNNLYETFLRAFNKNDGLNYFGVKFYPALGYLPSDSRLDMIFKICAEKKIPVVSHCGGASVSTFEREIEVNRSGNIEIVPGNNRKERADFLNEPREWKTVLENNSNLHLNLGHFGSRKTWLFPDGPVGHRKKVILGLMKDHKVFSDFSFNLGNNYASDAFVIALNSDTENGKLIRERTMFGTDFWVILPDDLKNDQRYFIEKTGHHAENMLVNNVMKFLQLEHMLA
jgi:predicted TIM-barrel fold metal-dependent hydrolase